jgi:hypothetical protein
MSNRQRAQQIVHQRELIRPAMAICRERCAYRGEPPCFEISKELGEAWPPTSCDAPSCVILAATALAMFLNPQRKP